MNNLGGMVFIVAGIALGYWVATGHAANFLQAVNQGSGSQTQTQQNPGSGLFGLPNIKPWWMQTISSNVPQSYSSPEAMQAAFPANVPPNNTIGWNVV